MGDQRADPSRFSLPGRRHFLRGLTMGGLVGVAGWRPTRADAEPPPETTRLRLVKIPSICRAPQYVADELLRAEGFTDVQYVQKAGALGITEALGSGEANINNHFVAPILLRVEAGDPIVILSGLHVGCFEVFATKRAMRAILKANTICALEPERAARYLVDRDSRRASTTLSRP